MKKILLTLSMVLLAVAFMYGPASAGVSGSICSACHTMHNSQDGTDMAESATPQAHLLRAGCVACHTSATTQTNSLYGAPAVLHTTDPVTQGGTKTNAGGDFYWVATVGDGTAARGHNVSELAALDSNMPGTKMVPPGFDNTFESAAAGKVTIDGNFDTQLTCAGTFGCHGDHDNGSGDLDSWAGIKGAHHSNTTGSATVANNPTTIGNSFRFLLGIKGLENVNWNWGEAAGTHNEYFGENNTADRSAGGETGVETTISYFCAECHGTYHGSIDLDGTSGSPWVRHPTDINLPDSGEYDDYNSDNGDNTEGNYALDAPVARPTVPTSSSATVVADGASDTGAIVMCLSCHRAHGSPENDLLRWAYSDMDAGGSNTNGCFVCHTDKN